MNGATPILLPGNMCDTRMWGDRVRAAFPGAIDADLARDGSIDAMALRALGAVDGAIVPVGFSMGAIVALSMARLAPERLAAIVLLDCNPGADLPERAAVRPAQQRKVREGGLDELVVGSLMPNYFASSNAGDPALEALVRAMATNVGEAAFVTQSEALRTRPDQWSVVADLAVPALIACGAEDRLCLPDWHRRIALSASRSRLHIVEGAGHMLPLEQPRQLANIIDRWWADCRRSA